MAALFCRVACLVIFLSDRRSLKAVDVKLACLATQHSRWPNSPRAFAAATQGKKMETAGLFVLAQGIISASQFSSTSFTLLFWMAELFLIFQLSVWVWLGANSNNWLSVHGPPVRQEGIPAHTQSPQMTEVPLPSFWWFPSSMEGLLVLACQWAAVNFFLYWWTAWYKFWW